MSINWVDPWVGLGWFGLGWVTEAGPTNNSVITCIDYDHEYLYSVPVQHTCIAASKVQQTAMATTTRRALPVLHSRSLWNG